MHTGIVNFFFISWFVVGILVVIWTARAVPNKELFGKYPSNIKLLLSVPFSSAWEKYISNDEDKSILRKYRSRVFFCFLAFVVPFSLFLLYSYLYLESLK